jgi:hypothetical protein
MALAGALVVGMFLGVGAVSAPAGGAAPRDQAAAGYWLVAADGGIFSFGSPFYGALSSASPATPVVGMSATPGGAGYREVERSGLIGSYGDAATEGAWASASPAVGIITPDPHFFVEADQDGAYFEQGGTFDMVSAPIPNLNAPIVGIAAASSGWWMTGADGGIFTFHGAPFFGSLGALHLNAPIVGIAATPDGGGYWLVASDGGVFAFGDAAFLGSMGGKSLNAPIVGMAPAPDGNGYWLVAADGGIFSFGDAPFLGSLGALHLNAPIVGIAAG